MKNQLSKTCVTECELPFPLLVVQVFSTIHSENKMVFQVPLTRLGFYENHLNRDRFFNFSLDEQKYPVTYQVTGELMEWFTEKLNWISGNVHHRWSFDLLMRTALDGEMKWTFSQASDALMFKLSC